MKKRKEDEHDDKDRWVVSYADFITLLFAFFTTMYAISHVDAGKLERFTGSMRSAFKSSIDASKPLIEGIASINYADIETEKDVKKTLEKFKDIEGIAVSRDARGVIVSFGDSVLFDSGAADIRDGGKPLLSSILSVIRKTQNKIVVEGHTDNMPVKSSRYPSNWELSAARATSALMYLLKENDVSPERFSAAGYGEYRPVASNATSDGRIKNRRVDIIFVSRKDGK